MCRTFLGNKTVFANEDTAELTATGHSNLAVLDQPTKNITCIPSSKMAGLKNATTSK